MTTIAIKDGIIAYDSRVTRGATIMDDDACKRYYRDGVVFITSGSTCDYEPLMDAFFDPKTLTENIDASAFAVKNGELYTVACNKSRGLWVAKENPNQVDAMGSGEDHALTAMDCGKTAVEAVEMAKKRDTNTGGRVRTYKINQDASE